MSDELTRNSGKTAISRSKISSPMRYIIGLNPKLDTVFHQGPGLEGNPDRKKLQDLAYGKVVEYDPTHGPTDREILRNGDCDQAVSIYVLNVLPPKTRRKALLDIFYSLKPGGTAYIAVRSVADVEKNRGDWKQSEDGYQVSRGRHSNFQKGFTKEDLKEALMREFASIEVFDEGGFIIGVAKRKGGKKKQ